MFDSVIFWAVYAAVATVIGFASMGRDKYLAQTGRWRISENMLMAIAILGGSIGSIAGMFLFRHKTRHKKFRIGLPLILVLQVILLIAIARAK